MKIRNLPLMFTWTLSVSMGIWQPVSAEGELPAEYSTRWSVKVPPTSLAARTVPAFLRAGSERGMSQDLHQRRKVEPAGGVADSFQGQPLYSRHYEISLPRQLADTTTQ